MRRPLAARLTDRTGGIVFSVVSSILNVALVLVLFVAELGLPFVRDWFDRHFEPLGSNHGVGWLGLIMVRTPRRPH